jgi:hypothetical protein
MITVAFGELFCILLLCGQEKILQQGMGPVAFLPALDPEVGESKTVVCNHGFEMT